MRRYGKARPICDGLEQRVLLSFAPNPPSFTAPVDYAVGQGPSSIAVGELGSGFDAVAVATTNETSNNVSVYIKDSAGVFASPVTYSTGNQPRAVLIGDLDGNGTGDLAVANFADNDLSILLFQTDVNISSSTVPVGNGPDSIAIGDFNQYRYGVDLAVANYYDNDISILAPDPVNGGYEPAVNYPVGHGPCSLIAADLNGDGSPDLVVANSTDNTISVLMSAPEALTFASTSTFPTGDDPSSIAVGDFNGDGIPDLAVTNKADNTVSILLGDGKGSFTPYGSFPTGNEPVYVATADLDGDGNADLVVADAGDNDVSVLIGDGHGNFSAPHRFSTGISPSAIAVGDLNPGTGTPDLIVANSGSNDICALFNTAITPPSFASQINSATAAAPDSITTADFYGDGKTDVAVTGPFSVVVLLNEGNGVFAPGVSYALDFQPECIASGDFNHDGKPDLVAGSGPSDRDVVAVLLNNGDGTFSAPTIYDCSTYVPKIESFVFSVVVADVNHDGNLDLLAVNNVGGVGALLGDGKGGFSPPTGTYNDVDYGFIAVADFNNDGYTDLVASDPTNSADFLFAPGLFTPPQRIPLDEDSQSIVAGDFNDDGNIDVAVVADPYVEVLLGDGKGDFKLRRKFFVPYGATSIVTGDFNGDGTLDLAIANDYSNTADVMLGDGAGDFTNSFDFPVQQDPFSLAVGDFNSDGKPDLVTANLHADTVSVLLNTAQFKIPSLSINDVSEAEGNSGTTSFQFSVSMDEPSSEPVTVYYQTADGTATAAAGDYQTALGEAEISAGQTSVQITVNVYGNTKVEPNETFFVSLYAPTGATIARNQGVGTIVNDDINQPPVALDDSGTTEQGYPVAINVLANDSDPDGDPISITTIVTAPAHGTAAINGTQIQFIPNASFVGTDSLVYQITDGQGGFATATVTISVTAQPPTPTIQSSTTLVASSNLVSTGDPVTFTATITSFGFIVPGPSGSVLFMEGTTVLGNGFVDTDGIATFSTKALAVGTHSVYAKYGGDKTYGESGSSDCILHVNGIECIPSVESSTLPTAIIIGARTPGRVTIDLSNESGSPTTGSGTIQLYIATNWLAPTTNLLIGTMKIRSLSIDPYTSKRIEMPVSPQLLGMAPGNYTLLVSATDSAGTVTYANGPQLVKIVAPAIDFSEQMMTPANVASGGRGTGFIQLSITNNGNIVSKGPVHIEISASQTSGQLGTLIVAVIENFVLGLAKSRKVIVPLKTIPVLADGSYFFVAQVTDPLGETSLVSSDTTTYFAAPFIQLAATLGEVVKLASGDTLTLTNNGNNDDKGSFLITFGFSYDAAGLTPAGQTESLRRVFRIKGGASIKVHFNDWAKITAGFMSSASYFLTLNATDINGKTALAVSTNNIYI